MGDSDPPTSEQAEAGPESGDQPDEAGHPVESSEAGNGETSSPADASEAQAPDAAEGDGGGEGSSGESVEAEPFDPAEDVQDDGPAPATDDGAAPEPVPPPEPTLEERLAEAQAGKRRVREQMLRVAADFDNYRKRSAKDVEDARRRARQSTLRDLLPVFDNLERATIHVEPSTDSVAVAEGIRMVIKQFLDTLKRLDVERIDAVGASFDPAHHESFQLVESSEHAPGTVVSVVQPGYRMGGDLLRPAMVAVSKGPPAEPPEASAQGATSDEDDGEEKASSGGDDGEEQASPEQDDSVHGEDGEGQGESG